MSLWTILAEFALVIFVGVCIVLCFSFSVKAANGLKSKTYDTDERLRKAHDYLTWSSVISGIGIGLVVLAIASLLVLSVVFAPEELIGAASAAEAAAVVQKSKGTIETILEWTLWACITTLIAFSVALGILCFKATYEITLSSNRSTVTYSYDNSIYAAIAGLAAFVPILIWGIVRLYHYIESEKRVREEKQHHAQLEQELQEEEQSNKATEQQKQQSQAQLNEELQTLLVQKTAAKSTS